MKRGIDVSQNNGTINWDLVKGQIDFAILRIGWIGNKNNHTIDKQFERNYNECKRLGIPIGAYVYCYCNEENTAISGANWTKDRISGKSFDLPIFIDMEDSSIVNLGKEKLTNISVAFNTKIQEAGLKAGVYANRDWFNNHLNKDLLKSRYTTWIAHYGVNDPNAYQGQFDMWQNSSTGRINGINGNVDTNYLYSDSIQNSTSAQTSSPSRKTNEEIADEIIRGKWGSGRDRENRLTEAGYDYNAIQKIVNEKLRH